MRSCAITCMERHLLDFIIENYGKFKAAIGEMCNIKGLNNHLIHHLTLKFLSVLVPFSSLFQQLKKTISTHY